MNPNKPLALLGGLTPTEFMKSYWQKKPLLIRQALPGFKSPISAAALKKLAKSDAVEARLISREGAQWQMEHGPFATMPKMSDPDWTLLVQSVDIHDDAAAALMHQFRFVPDVRLDDLMMSLATVGGGVGPHFDSYDVFLLQAKGRRRWRFGQQDDLSLVPELPLKILKHFTPTQEVILEPGDMLYLPPQVAHDGVALEECMTISVGFRAPDEAALARGMLEAAADQITARLGLASGPYGEPALPGPSLNKLYRDPAQTATGEPGKIPEQLLRAALQAVKKIKFDEALATRFLGCWLTEPNQAAVFETGDLPEDDFGTHWLLDRRTRMLYRGKQLFINGEAAHVKPEKGLKLLADQRVLFMGTRAALALSDDARDAIEDWLDAGWLHIAQRVDHEV
jgi:50S ribosomal protein L16 3-hydroxylase